MLKLVLQYNMAVNNKYKNKLNTDRTINDGMEWLIVDCGTGYDPPSICKKAREIGGPCNKIYLTNIWMVCEEDRVFRDRPDYTQGLT